MSEREDLSQHNCTTPLARPSLVGIKWFCPDCNQIWRWDGVGWLRINPDGSPWRE